MVGWWRRLVSLVWRCETEGAGERAHASTAAHTPSNCTIPLALRRSPAPETCVTESREATPAIAVKTPAKSHLFAQRLQAVSRLNRPKARARAGYPRERPDSRATTPLSQSRRNGCGGRLIAPRILTPKVDDRPAPARVEAIPYAPALQIAA